MNPGPAPLIRSWRSPGLFAALIILVCAAAAYGSSLNGGFRFDDEELIVRNHALLEPNHLVRLLGKPYLSYFRPVVYLSFFADARLWGLNPVGYHLTGLLIHTANALLVFLLVRTLWGPGFTAILTALLFAVHPLEAVPVNYIADRGNLIVAFFCLSGLLLMLPGPAASRYRPSRLLGAYFCFVLALLSRENAFLFPLYAALILFVAGKLKDRPARLFLIASFVTAVLYFILRQRFFFFWSIVLPSHVHRFQGQDLLAFSRVIFEYLRTAATPGDIHMIREIALPAANDPVRWLIPIPAAAITLLCCLNARRKNAVFLGISWFLISVLPLYGFMLNRPEMGYLIQDNQAYLASFGLFLLMAFGLETARRRLGPRLWVVLVALLFAGYTARAISFNAVYRNEGIFLKEWERLAPRCRLVKSLLGTYYHNRGQNDRAAVYYAQCLSGGIEDARPLYNLGDIAFQNNDLETARRFFVEALSRDPSFKEARLSLSSLFALQGDVDSAERLLIDADRAEPDWPFWRLNLVKIAVQRGRPEEAARQARSLIRDFPSFETPRFMLITLDLARGNVNEALRAAEEIIKRSPDPKTAGREIRDLFRKAGYPLTAGSE